VAAFDKQNALQHVCKIPLYKGSMNTLHPKHLTPIRKMKTEDEWWCRVEAGFCLTMLPLNTLYIRLIARKVARVAGFCIFLSVEGGCTLGRIYESDRYFSSDKNITWNK